MVAQKQNLKRQECAFPVLVSERDTLAFLGGRSFGFIPCLVCLIKDGWHYSVRCVSFPWSPFSPAPYMVKENISRLPGNSRIPASRKRSSAVELFVEGRPSLLRWTYVLYRQVLKEEARASLSDYVHLLVLWHFFLLSFLFSSLRRFFFFYCTGFLFNGLHWITV